MRLPLLLLAFLYLNHAKSQTPESVLEKIQSNYTPEKIYVQYDKANYVAGETIWFKAYLMDGFLPSKKSTVFSIELLNEIGVVIQKKNLSINGSAAIGQFETDKLLPQGNYTVRAFTRNLMNFGTDKFYYNTIEIYNPTTLTNRDVKVDEPTVKFLPESGNFVASIKNNLAFICTNVQGKPLNVSGKIIDENGKAVATFASTHNGMGVVSFLPVPNVKYNAECIIGNEYKKTIALPNTLQEGVSLNVKRENGKTFFTVNSTTVTNENLLPSYILGVQENALAFKVSLPENNKVINGEIPISQLPTGILQITVFNKANKPLAERLVFINSGDYMPKDVFKIDTIGLGKREKNSFSYAIEDTLIGTFSVSVTEEDGETNKNENIVSRFLLTSDIKGYVQDPNYYFESKDAAHEQNLDLVMLTNGWRKYSWGEMYSGNYPSMQFKDPNFISINGSAINNFTKEILKNTELKALVKTKDKQIDFVIFTTDKNGKFEFNGLNFEDTAIFSFKNSNLFLQFTSEPIVNLLTVAKSNLPTLYNLLPATNSIITKTKNRYSNNNLANGNGVLLDEIIIQSIKKAKNKEFELSRPSIFGPNATRTLDLTKEPPSSQNIFDYLKSRLNGVNITGGPIDYFVNYRNSRSLMGGPTPMSIFLDGFQIEPNLIATLRASEVIKVEVFANSIFSASGGVMAITTGRQSKFVAGAGGYIGGTALVVGFSPTKEFFSPNYKNEYDNSTVKSDNRTTLYWNPYLNTTAQNKGFSFGFYNSDIVKKYKVVLEGMLENGQLVHIEKVVE